MFTLAMLILIASVSTLTIVFYNNAVSDEINSQKAKLHFLKKAYELNDLAYFDNIESSGNRITIIDKNGSVVYDNEVDSSKMENHADREEVVGAITNGIASSYRFSDTKYEHRLYSAILLDNGMVLRISKPRTIIFNSIIEFLKYSIIIIILTVLLSFIYSKRTSKKILVPFKNINLDKPLENNVYDELSPFLIKIDTQYKKIDSQLENIKIKNQQIKHIIENISEGIIVISHDNSVLRMNSIASKLTGIKENEYFLNSCRIIELKNAVESALQGQSSREKIKINNNIYILEASSVPLDNNDYGVFISIRNIDEEENREKMRRQFTANVSHELKTPLTSIMGTAELFSENLISGKDTIKFGKKIYNESYRLLNMIEDMIKLSMLDENIMMNFEKVELSRVVLNVIEELQANASKHQIKIVHKLEELEISGISNLIHDMLYNLIDNAIKYNNENGFVEINGYEENAKKIIVVKDSGIGIKETEFNNIFERFYRVDKSRSKETGGSGLGLSIVKHIALIHNASIELYSEGKNKGSEFKVIF